MNTYEWQIKMFTSEKAPLSELKAIAEDVANYELYTIGVVLGFSVLGFMLYWLLGIRGDSR